MAVIIVKSPCYNCSDRTMNCHSSCDNYKNWKDGENKIKSYIVENKKLNSALNSRQLDAIKRMKRK